MQKLFPSRILSRIAVLILLIPAAMFAQADKGSLVGTVEDSSNAPVPLTEVKVVEVNTNIVRVTQTNDAGNYSFPLLDPGTYTVEADRAGFKHAARTNVRLDANSTIRVDFATIGKRFRNHLGVRLGCHSANGPGGSDNEDRIPHAGEHAADVQPELSGADRFGAGCIAALSAAFVLL